jgi:hypothetical protein
MEEFDIGSKIFFSKSSSNSAQNGENDGSDGQNRGQLGEVRLDSVSHERCKPHHACQDIIWDCRKHVGSGNSEAHEDRTDEFTEEIVPGGYLDKMQGKFAIHICTM